MGLRVLYRGGPNAGRALEFGDEVEKVVFGRDPSRCQVVFDPGATAVGREHAAIERVLGRYRLVVDADHEVWVDGRRAMNGQEIFGGVDVRFGRKGPRVVIQPTGGAQMPKTLPAGSRQPGQVTLMQRLQRASRTNKVLTVVCIVVVGVAVAAGVGAFTRTEKALSDTRSEIETARDDLNATQAGLAQTRHELTITKREMGALDEKQVKALNALRTAVSEGMEPVIERAKNAVFLLVSVTPDGEESGFGSAWLVAPKTLATNAHVATGVDELMGMGMTVYARARAQPDGKRRQWKVTSTASHPGYLAFQQMWGAYKPAQQGELVQPISACDVAALTLESEAKDIAPLEIAADEELHALRGGDRIAFAGYPMENLTGTNLRSPEPKSQIGTVTSVTDFFFGVSRPEDRHLVQHSLPGAGGASGSPVLNDQGRVVALFSAVNLELLRNYQGRALRIATGAQINFAQRADLLRELLDGAAGEAHAQRAPAWERGLATYDTAEQTSDRAMARMHEAFVQTVSPRHVKEQTFDGTLTQTPPPELANYGGLERLTLTIAQPGTFCLAVVSPDLIDLDIALYDEKEEHRLAAHTSFYPHGSVHGDLAKGTYRLWILGPQPGVTFRLAFLEAQ